MFAPFTKATGIEVVTTGTPDPAKLKLMEQSGNVEWDIVDAEGQMMYLAAKDGELPNRLRPRPQGRAEGRADRR